MSRQVLAAQGQFGVIRYLLSVIPMDHWKFVETEKETIWVLLYYMLHKQKHTYSPILILGSLKNSGGCMSSHWV